jgi:hypothetical protein
MEVAIHPNIPAPKDLEDVNFLQRCKNEIVQFLRNIFLLFLCALFIPEYVLAWAIRQNLMASKISKQYGTALIPRPIGGSDAYSMLAAKFRVTETHGFFMIMGGFHYFSNTGENYPLTWQDVGDLLKKKQITLPRQRFKTKARVIGSPRLSFLSRHCGSRCSVSLDY